MLAAWEIANSELKYEFLLSHQIICSRIALYSTACSFYVYDLLLIGESSDKVF